MYLTILLTFVRPRSYIGRMHLRSVICQIRYQHLTGAWLVPCLPLYLSSSCNGHWLIVTWYISVECSRCFVSSNSFTQCKILFFISSLSVYLISHRANVSLASYLFFVLSIFASVYFFFLFMYCFIFYMIYKNISFLLKEEEEEVGTRWFTNLLPTFMRMGSYLPHL